jgi:hypothetical protein
VESVGEGGLAQHGIQVCPPDARQIDVFLSGHGISSLDVPKPAQLALEGYAEVQSFYAFHHLLSTFLLLVPNIPGFVHNSWHWEVSLSTVCVTRCVPSAAARRQAVLGGVEVSAKYALHLLHLPQAPSTFPFPSPPAMELA